MKYKVEGFRSLDICLASTGETAASHGHADLPVSRISRVPHVGLLIVNADDWGRDHETTDRTLECFQCRTVSSVSAMVFMEDSVRAAAIAREQSIDAGLHLNFTSLFSGSTVTSALKEHQRRIASYLTSHRFAQAMYHPGLHRSFEFVVNQQLEEFHRIYGRQPDHIDGHHHMHLSVNVVLRNLLPEGTALRRNFSFEPGEKNVWNRMYRLVVDRIVSRRHDLPDYLFSLPPLDPPARLQRIFTLARTHIVELEVHPAKFDEHRFLVGGEFERWTEGLRVASAFALVRRRQAGN